MDQYFSTTQDSEQAPPEAMYAFIYHPVNNFLIADGSVISPIWPQAFLSYISLPSHINPLLLKRCAQCLSMLGLPKQNATDQVPLSAVTLSQLWRLEGHDPGTSLLSLQTDPAVIFALSSCILDITFFL